MGETTQDILQLAQALIRIPSVTVGAEQRLDQVQKAADVITDFLSRTGLDYRRFEGNYPALLVGFPGQLTAPVMLSGHFDVVAPEPDDSQFEPRIEGDYLWGRGAADMKTVVASYLVWMKETRASGAPYPPVCLLLVGNEESGEQEPWGTPFVLDVLAEESGYAPEFLIAGERTEESGGQLWGEVCTQNRGVMRFDIVGHGVRGHTGVARAQADLTTRIAQARADIHQFMEKHLTLDTSDGWWSGVRYPFMQVGELGIYNITADRGVLGVEVRPIPQDDIEALFAEIREYCRANDFEIENLLKEPGVVCDSENPYLKYLLAAVEQASSAPAMVGKKMPGTSARFAPGGQGVVWGQSGIGPHSKAERHYIPSIEPYYRALQAFGLALISKMG